MTVLPAHDTSIPLSEILEVYQKNIWKYHGVHYINVVFDHAGEVSLQIIDMTGRTVYRTIHNGGGLTDLQMDIAELNPGLFFLKLDAGGSSNVLRFIKQ